MPPLANIVSTGVTEGRWLLHKSATAVARIARPVISNAVGWALLGIAAGVVAACLSLMLGTLLLQEGFLRMTAWPVLPLLVLLPLLGLVLFGIHGIYRGGAKGALALEAEFGLVDHVVGRAIALLEREAGTSLGNLPLQRFENVLKQTLGKTAGKLADPDQKGIVGWVVRKASRAIESRLESVLLTAYRQESHADGGGGVDLAKVSAHAREALSLRLADLVLGPVNSQRLLLCVLFFGLGIGALPLLLGLPAFWRPAAG